MEEKYTLPKKPKAGSSKHWLRFALSSLLVAKQPPAEPLVYNTYCTQAQMAAEMCLKGLLMHYRLNLIKTHDISVLLEALASNIEIPEAVSKAVILTEYAVTQRYPGDFPEPTESDWREAVHLAEITFDWAYTIISKGT
jgi:HEPN domain-containing protein